MPAPTRSIAQLAPANLAPQDALLHPESYEWQPFSPAEWPFRAGDTAGLRLTCRHCGGVVTHAEIPNDMLMCETCGGYRFSIQQLVSRKSSSAADPTTTEPGQETGPGDKDEKKTGGTEGRKDEPEAFPIGVIITFALIIVVVLGIILANSHHTQSDSCNSSSGPAVVEHTHETASQKGPEVITPLPPSQRPAPNPALEVKDSRGNTLLAQALLQNNDARAAELIRQGADVNILVDIPESERKTSYGFRKAPAVAFAAIHGKLELVKLMLLHGADLTESEAVGGAAAAGQEKMVDFFLANGAPLDEALLGAIFGGNASLARALRQRGAKIDNEYCAFLAEVICLTLPDATAPDEIVDRLRLALELGAKPDRFTFEGRPLLCYAVAHGNEVVSRMLLEHGANPNTRDDDGNFALLWALTGNTYDPFLLEPYRTFTVEKENVNVRTEIVRALLRHGADVKACEAKMGSTLNYVLQGYHTCPREKMQSRGDITELIRLLLEHGADANLADKHGEPPLLHAIASDNAALVRLVLKHGANVNVSIKPHDDTPLISIIKGLRSGHLSLQNDVDIARLLLQNGAKVNLRDTDGKTALRLATEPRNVLGSHAIKSDIIFLLKQYGAKE